MAVAFAVTACTTETESDAPARERPFDTTVPGDSTAAPTREFRPTVPPTPTASSTPPAAAGEAKGTVQLQLGEPVPFPADLAVVVETGGRDGDAPPQGFRRLYRDSAGTIRIESLFEPPYGVGPQAYVYGSTFAADGSDIVAAVCSGGYCGDVGSPVNPQVVLHRSRDGGVTWTVLTTLAGAWAPYALQGDSIVLGNRYDPKGTIAQMRFIRAPSGEPVTPPAIGDPQWPVAITSDELVWLIAGATLVLGDGRSKSGVRYDGITWTFSVGGRQERRYVQVPSQVAARTTAFIRDGRSAALHISDPELLTAAYFAHGGGVVGGAYVGLAVVDLAAAVLHPIADLPVLPQGIRGPMAVQLGPFARVVTGVGNCLPIRVAPSAGATSLACAADRVLLRRTGLAKAGWLPVTTPAGVEGWADTEFLEYAPGATSSGQR